MLQSDICQNDPHWGEIIFSKQSHQRQIQQLIIFNTICRLNPVMISRSNCSTFHPQQVNQSSPEVVNLCLQCCVFCTWTWSEPETPVTNNKKTYFCRVRIVKSEPLDGEEKCYNLLDSWCCDSSQQLIMICVILNLPHLFLTGSDAEKYIENSTCSSLSWTQSFFFNVQVAD